MNTTINKERLQAGIAQARAASNLFRSGMDITSFQDSLTKAEEAIHSFKVASGMAMNYPAEPYGLGKDAGEDTNTNNTRSRASTLSSVGTLNAFNNNSRERSNSSNTLSTIGSVNFRNTNSVTGVPGTNQENVEPNSPTPIIPVVNATRGIKMYENPISNPLVKYSGKGGRRHTYRNKQKRRRASTTHKRRRI